MLNVLNKKFGTNFSAKDLLSNITVFAEKSEDSEEQFLRLEIKRLIAKAISFSCYETFEVSYPSPERVKVEAKFFWKSEDVNPAGIGFCELFLGQIFPDQFLSNEERLSKLEDCARSKALSKALTNAGIGLGLNFNEPEDIVAPVPMAKEPEIPKEFSESGLPKPTGKRGRPRKNPEPVIQEKVAEEVVKEESPQENLAPTPEPVQEVLDIPMPAKVDSRLEAAYNAVADIGNYKGKTLKEIYEVAPKNLIFLANRASAVAEEAKIIIASDKELIALLA